VTVGIRGLIQRIGFAEKLIPLHFVTVGIRALIQRIGFAEKLIPLHFVTGVIIGPDSAGFGDSELHIEVLHFVTSLARVKHRAWAKLNDKT